MFRDPGWMLRCQQFMTLTANLVRVKDGYER